MAKELTDRQKSFIENKIKKEVEKGTFKGNPEHYRKLLIHIETEDIEGWNVWQEKSHVKIELEGANFYRANLRSVDLRGANLRRVDLSEANLKNARLSGAQMQNVNIMNTNLMGAGLFTTNLNGARGNYCNLRSATLILAGLEGADFIYADLQGSDLRSIRIGVSIDGTKGNAITNFKEAIFGDSALSIDYMCKTHEKEQIKILSQGIINNVQFVDPIFGRKVRDEAWLNYYKKNCEGSKWKKFLRWLWEKTSDYGRSFSRWALWSVIIAEVFTAIFAFAYYCNPSSFKATFISLSWWGVSFLYYSVVTFTTLGFGDIVPMALWLQIIVMAEVIIGYVMLGGLISILANKLARRS